LIQCTFSSLVRIILFYLQDETPLFLAAREGSYEAAKCLLDHYANRDITDHMDRLPRDVALERVHPDILRLLDEYHLNSPMSNGLSNSPSVPNGSFCPPGMNQKQVRPKSRKSRVNHAKDQLSPQGNGRPVAIPCRSSGKNKRKKPQQNGRSSVQNPEASSIGGLSPADLEIESPTGYPDLNKGYDPTCNGHMCISPQDMQALGEITTSCAMAHALEDHNRMTYVPAKLMPPMEQMQVQRSVYQGVGSSPNRQVGMNEMYSSSSPASQGSGNGVYSSNNSPSSSGSSPINQNVGSPNKKGLGLPTSPAHIQAMQNAQFNLRHSPHNYLETFGLPPDLNSIPVSVIGPDMTRPKNYPPQTHINNIHNHRMTQIDQYPTPPSQHSTHVDSTPQHVNAVPLPDTPYLTPSPDSPGQSPGQWSSSSPHSAHSDWSEGISSPPQAVGQMPANRVSKKHLADAIYI
jgi:Notch-like protein